MTIVDVLLCGLAFCVFWLLVVVAFLMHAEDDPYDGRDELAAGVALYPERPPERRAAPQRPPGRTA